MATKNHYVWVSRRKRLRLNKEAWQPRTTMFGFQEGKYYQIRRHGNQEPLCLGFKKEKTKIK